MVGRQYKIDAARAALDFVEGGMRLGIGTGSTAEEFVRLLGERVAQGLDIIGVPTSERTARLCTELSIPLTTLDETPALDLTVDGADEVTPDLALIKGGGGALLREKIVAAASKGMVVVADDSKAVPHLGAFPLPIEVNRFGLRSTVAAIEEVVGKLALSARLSQRMAEGRPFETDGGHLIIDASFGRIPDPRALSAALNGIPGVVEHGIFLDLATHAIFAGAQGVRTVTRPS